MQPPQEPSPTQPDSQPVDIGRIWSSKMEHCLLAPQAVLQVQQDLRRQAELQQRAIQLGQELRKSRCRLLSRVDTIKEQLEAIEINLEKPAIFLGQPQRTFWQAVGLED